MDDATSGGIVEESVFVMDDETAVKQTSYYKSVGMIYVCRMCVCVPICMKKATEKVGKKNKRRNGICTRYRSNNKLLLSF